MTRRATLLVVLVLAGSCLAGCSQAKSVVTVLGPWMGEEQIAFETVLKAVRIPYEYQGTRNVGAELQAAVAAGNPPDIAVLPSLGDVADQIAADSAQPIEDLITDDRGKFAAFWLPELARDARSARHVYTLPIKANLKSMVWYDPETTPAPRSWAAALAEGSWCLGLGDPPSSGWPASDWIEDLLLHQPAGVEAYRDWVAGDLKWSSSQIRTAWRDFERVAKSTPGGASAALLTRFNDAGRGMRGGRNSCRLEHQASFIRGVYQNYGGDRFTFTQFPAGDAADRRVEVSVDVAVLFTEAEPAEQMIKRLATADVQEIWPKRLGSGAFSVHGGVPVDTYGTKTDQRIRKILFGEKGIKFCLDASDLMPAAVRDAFYRGLKEYLSKPERLPEILSRLDAAASASRPSVAFPACA